MTDTIEEEEFSGYLDDISRIGETAGYTPEFDWWHTLMSDRDQQSFAVEGVPGGSSWLQWKLRALSSSPDHQILNASGRLMKSLQRGSSEGVDEVNARESAFGTTVEYARIHQTGGRWIVDDYLYNGAKKLVKRPGDPINLPQRPFATLTEQMIDGLADVVSDSLVEQMKG